MGDTAINFDFQIPLNQKNENENKPAASKASREADLGNEILGKIAEQSKAQPLDASKIVPVKASKPQEITISPMAQLLFAVGTVALVFLLSWPGRPGPTPGFPQVSTIGYFDPTKISAADIARGKENLRLFNREALEAYVASLYKGYKFDDPTLGASLKAALGIPSTGIANPVEYALYLDKTYFDSKVLLKVDKECLKLTGMEQNESKLEQFRDALEYSMRRKEICSSMLRFDTFQNKHCL
jgi:hypothetical protein